MLAAPLRMRRVQQLLVLLACLFVGQLVLSALRPSRQADVSEARVVHLPKRLSVILLGYVRVDSLRQVVHAMQRYADFVTDIVIWNNNVDTELTESDFGAPLKIPIRIINSKENKYFVARFTACLMSSGDYCYFQDDDWRIDALRALYANFLRHPHLLHTITNEFVHYLSWTWTFFDPAVNMHSGFSWVGTGAIADKPVVLRFMEQLKLLSDSDALLADMYFSTWMNQVPYQLETPLVELETRFGFSSVSNGIQRNQLHMANAARILYDQLKAGTTTFTTVHQQPRWEQRDAKAPCHDDLCLFLTTAHNMPSPSRIIYRYGENITSLENRHKETFPPDHFLLHPYHHAVDGKLHTSWISAEGLARGDYFGLDLLMADACGIIKVSVSHKFQGDLRLQVTEMADFWTDSACEWTMAVDHRHGVTTHTYEQTARADLCRFRFIRFMVADPLPSSHLQVHEISVSKCASALLRPTF